MPDRLPDQSPVPAGQMSRRGLLAASGAVILTACASGRERRQERRHRRHEEPRAPGQQTPSAQLIDAYRSETGVRDFSVRIARNGSVLFCQDVGSYGPSTQINIASASKWLVGATVMVQVDAGRLSLAAPIGDYVTGLPSPYARLSLESLLSFTAGLPSLKKLAEFRHPQTISLADSARRAAELPLESAPGTQFDYGGANLQFVGAAVEAVNNSSWHSVFTRDIARPLGMSNTVWGRMNDRPDPSRPMANPVLQAGAWSSADDYTKLVEMLAADGTYRGQSLLSAEATSAMRAVRTAGVRKGFTAPGAESQAVEYSLAHWCERTSGLTGSACSFESSPGFYGTYPWIDHDTGVYGVILQKDRLQRVADATRRLRNGLISLHAQG